MDLFLTKVTDQRMFREEILPLLYTGLEVSDVPHVQEQALKAVNLVLERMEFQHIKSTLYTKVESLYVGSIHISLRINSLIAIHAMVKSLDKYSITSKILPLLKTKRTRDPGLMLAILAVYDEVSKFVDKDAIAQEILPELWKMALESQFTVVQFKVFDFVDLNDT
jgi:SCY1-like protein 2